MKIQKSEDIENISFKGVEKEDNYSVVKDVKERTTFILSTVNTALLVLTVIIVVAISIFSIVVNREFHTLWKSRKLIRKEIALEYKEKLNDIEYKLDKLYENQFIKNDKTKKAK